MAQFLVSLGVLSLPGENWLRLFVWLAIGFVVHFAYGRHHSVLRRMHGAGDRRTV